MELIIGDAIIENPVMWPVVSAFFLFSSDGWFHSCADIMNFIFVFKLCYSQFGFQTLLFSIKVSESVLKILLFDGLF